MRTIILNGPDRVLLEKLATSSSSAKECCRAQALLWLSEGMSFAEVVDLLGIHRSTVYRWADRFAQRADLPLAERFMDEPRSGRPPIALGVIDPLIDEVIDDDPHDFGYSSTGWTAELLRQYLQDCHGIMVSRKSVSRAIDRLDIHWKRPRYTLAERRETWRQAKGGLKKGSLDAPARSC
jgi:transposase